MHPAWEQWPVATATADTASAAATRRHPVGTTLGPHVMRDGERPRAVRARGHFPTEQAALKCLCLVTRSLDPTGRGKPRSAMRWKPALNAVGIAFNGWITLTGN